MADGEIAVVVPTVVDSQPDLSPESETEKATAFELRRVRFAQETKWIKVRKISNTIQYKDFLDAARTCFNIKDDIGVHVRDEDGVIIEEELFSLFDNIIFVITLNSIVSPSVPSTCSSSHSTVTIDDAFSYTKTSDLLDISAGFIPQPFITYTDLEDQTCPKNRKRGLSPVDFIDIEDNHFQPKKRHETNVQPNVLPSNPSEKKLEEPSMNTLAKLNILDKLEQSSVGTVILKEYKETKTLTSQSRKKLVNFAVNLLVERFGHHPNSLQKVNCAEEIVTAFPNLKDPGSAHGYEAYYEPLSRSGFIAWRLRSLWRRSTDKENAPVKKPVILKNTAKSNEIENVDEETVQEQLEFLKHACPKTQRDSIELAMRNTYYFRRSESKKIFENFQRFLDIPYLIDLDFTLMYPNIRRSDFSEDNILEVAKRNSLYSEASTEWDKATTAHLCLLKLIPPTAKGKKKAEREGIHTAAERLIVFHKIGNPLENVTTKTNQPCLLAVGPNRKAISSYFIAVEGKIIPIDARTSTAAFDLLFKSHFVFDTQYDPNLKTFFNFIQEFYYKMPSQDNFTARMREVRTWLLHTSAEM